MYGFGRLQQRTTCVFTGNQFQPYDNIAEKGCAGGLNSSDVGLSDRSFPAFILIAISCKLFE